MLRFTFLLTFILVFISGDVLGQTRIYVDTDANATECGSTPDGSTWECAYPALQDAFDEVDNASPSTSFEVWIAGGIYYPDNDNVDNNGDASIEHISGDQSESFTLTRDNVGFYGGFDGTDGSGGGDRETARNQRSSDTHPVTLSGDIDEDNSSAGNAYHVVYFDGQTSTGTTLTSATVLDGVTVTGGNANGSTPNNRGGGLYCDGANDNSGDPDICSPLLQRIHFTSNSASDRGGGAYINAANGGTASPTILNTRFTQNTASDGGAIFNNGDASSAVASGLIVNTSFLGNSSGSGGAIFNDADNGTAALTVINGTFAGNVASDGTIDGSKAGSAIINRGANLDVQNSIFWGHSDYAIYDNTTTTPVVAYSLIDGGQSNVDGIDYRSSNLDSSPFYVGANNGSGPDGTWGTSDDDLRRNWASAAIDNGNPAVLPPDTTDVDEDGNTSERVPALNLSDRNSGKTVDIGAYERGGIVPTGGVAHVDQSASGAGDGTSWTDAYQTLQNGLRANENAQASGSPGDVQEVQVATGTYVPTRRRDATDARSRTFYIDGDNVEVYAGYPSGGGTRAPDSNPVILSGDIDGDDNPFAPQSDTDGNTNTPSQTDHIVGSNAYNVIFLNAASTSITATTVLDGLMITAGRADGGASPANRGGGLLCNAGSGQSCSPSLRNTTFYGNHASNAGGAIANLADGTGSPSIQSTVLRGNASSGNGGALANVAQNGTGTSSPSLTNATVIANAALGDGGGIWNGASSSGETASPSITNVSFTGNTADGSGGTLYNNGTNGTATPVVVNSILWGNGNEVSGSNSTPVINHSIVEGGCPSSADCSGGNLLNENPQFADAEGSDGSLGTADDDLRLQGPDSGGGASPAIDAGDNDVISASADLGGSARRQDVGSVTDTGSPSSDSPYVDFGAFESNGSALPVELTNFTAERNEQAAVLNWSTASEQNNAGFYVQRRVSDASAPGARKTDDGGFTTLDGSFQEGAGTTTEGQSYSYRVADLEAGTQTFRLKQVDTDGSASFSDPVDVDIGLDGKYKLNTYPNPVSQAQATLEFAVKKQDDVTITLYNTLGQKVRTVYRGETPAEQTTRVQVDTHSLASGVYFVRLQGETVTATQRMTVVK